MTGLPFTNDLYSWMYETDIISLVDKRLSDVGYSWNHTTGEIVKLPYRLGDYKKNLTVEQARKVLSWSDGTSESETKKLLEYFWSISDDFNTIPSSTMIVNVSQCVVHDWIDVVLFNVVSKRCSICDTKKS